MNRCYLLALMVMLCAAPVFSQAPVSYDDVGVFININDSNSVAIGNYFVQQRNIPLGNIIEIDAPANETITAEEFVDLRSQIETILNDTGLKDKLNYFVTTKGVPLRVNYGGTLIQPDMRNASFDAELMLFLGRFASHIGGNTLIIPPGNAIRTQPYFNQDKTYRRSNLTPGTSMPNDLYLTTRLTGLTQEDAFALIDRSGPFTLVEKDSALFVFDRDPRPIQLVPYDSNLAIAGAMLAANGWNALVNSDSVFVIEQRNVLGYASWGSNDHYDHHYTQKARPKNHWLPGSLAETYVSTSARNFTPGQTGGQSRIADIIAEGVTGASGYVFEPYSIALTWVNVLFDRYIRGFNLAESFYMSNPTISWMAIVVGDPKSSIITDIPPVPTPMIDAPNAVCKGEDFILDAKDALKGWQRWFAGDSLTVLAAGPPYDASHPLWLGSDSTLTTNADSVGTQVYTFLNENFVGRGLAQKELVVLPEMAVAYSASADTVYLDEDPQVQFAANAPGATSWEWTFGDGDSSSDPSPVHRYTSAGTFHVSVTVSDANCSQTIRDIIRVLNTSGVDDDPAAPLALSIGINYPNPFAGVTAIPFTLPERMQARLSIVDALGRSVAVLADDVMAPGTHAVQWDATALLSGSYLCVLEVNGQVLTRRITVLK